MTAFVQPVKASAKKKYTSARIYFVLDESSSMAAVGRETADGVNAFIEEQKAFKQKAKFSLVTFSHQVRTVHDHVDLESVEPIQYGVSYRPAGYTALYDAIGLTVTSALKIKPKKTEKIIIAILTDGEENSSSEFSHSMVPEMIKQVQAEHGWEVIVVGANIDAEAVGGSLGVARGKSASFGFSGKGVADVMKTASYASNSARGMDYGWMKSAKLGGVNIELADGSLDIGSLYATVDKGIDEKLKDDLSTDSGKK